jgi:hypothetical protein
MMNTSNNTGEHVLSPALHLNGMRLLEFVLMYYKWNCLGYMYEMCGSLI